MSSNAFGGSSTNVTLKLSVISRPGVLKLGGVGSLKGGVRVDNTYFRISGFDQVLLS